MRAKRSVAGPAVGVATALLLVLFALGAGAYSLWPGENAPAVQEPEESQEPQVETGEAEEVEEAEQEVEVEVPLVIPEEDKQRKNPFTVDEEFLELGRKLYSSQCKMCHGPEGKGDGDLAEEMELTVLDLTDPELQKGRTEGEMFYILSKGHKRMPGQGERLRPQQMWSMITYIRTLAPAEEMGSDKKE